MSRDDQPATSRDRILEVVLALVALVLFALGVREGLL